MPPLDLAGRTVLLTGASRGIGLALTGLLVGEGARVIAVARPGAALDALAERFGDRVRPFAADLARPDEVDRLVAAMGRQEPGLSVLVNNAAAQTPIALFDPATEAVLRAARRELALDFESPMALTIGLLPLLRDRERAAVVTVSSALALVPKASAPVYGAAKAGLALFTRALRDQCRRDAPGLAVTDVVMTLVETDMTAGRGRGKIAPEEAAGHLLAAIRSGRPEIWIGRTRLLRAIHRIAPALAYRMMR